MGFTTDGEYILLKWTYHGAAPCGINEIKIDASSYSSYIVLNIWAAPAPFAFAYILPQWGFNLNGFNPQFN